NVLVHRGRLPDQVPAFRVSSASVPWPSYGDASGPSTLRYCSGDPISTTMSVWALAGTWPTASAGGAASRPESSLHNFAEPDGAQPRWYGVFRSWFSCHAADAQGSAVKPH